MKCLAIRLLFVQTDRASKWGSDFYGYRLKFCPIYAYRLFFFQLRLTKKLRINFFCFTELNINNPVSFVCLKQDHFGMK